MGEKLVTLFNVAHQARSQPRTLPAASPRESGPPGQPPCSILKRTLPATCIEPSTPPHQIEQPVFHEAEMRFGNYTVGITH
jgi:hypothetical protein